MSYNHLNTELISGIKQSFSGVRSKPIIHLNLLFVVSVTEFNALKEKFLDLSKMFETYISTPVISWVSISDVAREHGLTSDAIRKRLQNGDFEEDKDFKRVGGKIQVYQGAIVRLQRQRRSN